MKTTVIVERATGKIKSHYEGDARQSSYGGKWGNREESFHAELPEGKSYQDIQFEEVVLGDGQVEEDITFDVKHEYTEMMQSEKKVSYYKMIDNIKSEEELNADRLLKISLIRSERDTLLVEADHEMFKVEDASGDTSSIRSYRTDLRDITNSYKDYETVPSHATALDSINKDLGDFIWPTKPF